MTVAMALYNDQAETIVLIQPYKKNLNLFPFLL